MSVDVLTTPQRELWEARRAGFADCEFVGQESFMGAAEIRWLARRAEIGPGVRVLDLCCGVAGPGLFVVSELGCDYVGVDASAASIECARRRWSDRGVGLASEVAFEVGTVAPVPPGPYDVVLLLETLLAFRERSDLFAGISAALPVGARFALTVESGAPLTRAEQAAMPASDTVWIAPLGEVCAELDRVGLRVRCLVERTRSHLAVAEELTTAYEVREPTLAKVVGARGARELVDSSRLWSTWLRSGRVRKYAVVADKVRS